MKFEIAVHIRRAAGFALDVEFTCDAEAMGIVGPSGSGKSTLLDAIAGIEPAGRVVLDGEDVTGRPLRRRVVGYVTQDALLFPHLSVRQNLLFSPRATAMGDVPAALGIESLLDRMPRNLSGGERRRVALARAILSGPRLLLLDEPFAGLDEARRREAISLLVGVRRRFRLPMVAVSHVPEEVIGLTEHTVRLEGGRIAAAGPSATVLRAGETRIDNFFDGLVLDGQRVRVGDVELHATLPDGAAGAMRLACYASDIILAREKPALISARNLVATRVRAMTEVAGMAIVDLEAPAVRALVTHDAVRALELSPGVPVVAIIKASAIVCLGGAA